jgi:hypothetical protein
VDFTGLKLKNNRASGPDGLNGKLSEANETSLRLWKLVEKIGNEKILRSQWEQGLICIVLKTHTHTHTQTEWNDVRKLSCYLFAEYSI